MGGGRYTQNFTVSREHGVFTVSCIHGVCAFIGSVGTHD